jgi:hypothetical protein
MVESSFRIDNEEKGSFVKDLHLSIILLDFQISQSDTKRCRALQNHCTYQVMHKTFECS